MEKETLQMRVTKLWDFPRLRALVLLVVTYAVVWLSGDLIPSAYRAESLSFRIVLYLVVVLAVAIKNQAFSQFLDTFKPRNLIRFIPFLILMLVLVFGGRQIYYHLLPALDWSAPIETEQVGVLGGMPLLLRLLYPTVIAPIFEELVFREYAYRLIGYKWLAFLISSTVFAWMHTGFTIYFFMYWPMGMAFCLLYQRRGNVTESIIGHGLANFLVLSIPAISGLLW